MHHVYQNIETFARYAVLALILTPAFSGWPLMFADGQAAGNMYYVATTGSDSNYGTLSDPFRTLQKARDAVRTVNSSMTDNITVYLRGGTYILSSPIIFDERDSGTNGFDIIYKAYPGEQPILSGGQRITDWTSVGNGVYKGSIGSLRFRQLYVNGRSAIRAREPDEGFYYRVLSWDITNKLISVSNQQISNWARLSQVEMVMLRHWTTGRFHASSFTTSGSISSIALQEPDRSIAFSDHASFVYNNPYYFENAFELLDSEGEWYLDSSKNEVFYKPRAGENIETAEILAPTLENLLIISGTLDAPAHHIQFCGLTLKDTTWLLPNTRGIRGGQATEFTSQKIGAFVLENASNILMERNILRNLGGNGIILYSGTSDNIIRGNVLRDIAIGGIAIATDAVKNPSDPRITNRRNKVLNNYITKIGREFGGSVGILVGLTDGTVVEHNEIADLPYSGISIGYAGFTDISTQAQNNLIRYNLIHGVMNLLDDGGGIYTGNKQPGTQIVENYVCNQVRSQWEKGFPNAGIYLDEQSMYITVKNNVVENTPLALNLHGVSGNTFVNFTYTPIGGSTSGNTFATDSSFNLKTVKANAGLEDCYKPIVAESAVFQCDDTPSTSP